MAFCIWKQKSEEKNMPEADGFIERLLKGSGLTVYQRKALAALGWMEYEPPWWYWLDFFRANKN